MTRRAIGTWIHLNISFRLLVLLALVATAQQASGQTAANSSQPSPQYKCFPSGLCQPCPEDQRSSPACRPFQKRREITCASVRAISQNIGSRNNIRYDTARHKLAHDRLALQETPESRNGQHQKLKRDFFWQPNVPEADMTRAEHILASIDWDIVRKADAEAQGVGQANSRFTSWAPCARVVAKERADFFEFMVRPFRNTLIFCFLIWLNNR